MGHDDDPSEEAVREQAERRRRRARVFGEVLPDVTADERDHDRDPQEGEDWLRRQVPPHHQG